MKVINDIELLNFKKFQNKFLKFFFINIFNKKLIKFKKKMSTKKKKKFLIFGNLDKDDKSISKITYCSYHNHDCKCIIKIRVDIKEIEEFHLHLKEKHNKIPEWKDVKKRLKRKKQWCNNINNLFTKYKEEKMREKRIKKKKRKRNKRKGSNNKKVFL